MSGRTAEETYAECQSTDLLNLKDNNIDSANDGLIHPLRAINGSIDPGFEPSGFHFPDSDSLQMLKPSLISLLDQKAARSPIAISKGNTMLLTHAKRGRSLQGDIDGSEFSKKTAELQLYIVTWNMKGRVRL